jgi:hypothetical protein
LIKKEAKKLAFVYGGIFVLSLALLPFYFSLLHKKEKQPWLCTLFASISIVNLGYLLISVSKTVEFALFVNKVAYLGQVIIPLCMYMLISKLCGIKTPKWAIGILLGAAAGLFAVICTTGYTDWYYVSASLAYESGAAYLVKEYGVLHPVYTVYLITYFVAMIATIIHSIRKKKIGKPRFAGFIAAIVGMNIAVWLFEKFVNWEYEFLSIIYVGSELLLIFVYWMIQEYVHKTEVPPPIVKEVEVIKEIEVIKERQTVVVVNSAQKAEMINRLLSVLPDGKTLTLKVSVSGSGG